jgi:hypothetical protein
VIADSGANYYMFKEREFFETLLPTSGTVLLGDGKTTLSIKGVGTVKCKIGSNILVLHNVRYILDLSESTYSFFLHIQSANHKFESSFEDGLHVIFPDFKTKAVIGFHDIYLDALGKKTPHFTPFLPILWQCWVRKVGIMSGHPIALWGP